MNAGSTQPETADERNQTVQSLARGLSVITAFDADHSVMSMGDIARRTGLTRAATGRFIRTLEALGYVRRSDQRYSLTARVLNLGFSYLSALSLPEIAQPYLETLGAEVNESTSASVLDGADIVYVARVPTQRIMSLHISIGTRFPAAITSMGRVLLAARAPEEVDKLLAESHLQARTDFTVVQRRELQAELELVRRQGYSVVDQELEAGLRSIAVPIHQSLDGGVIAAVNVATTTARHSVASIVSEILPPLKRVAELISADFRAVRPFEASQRAGTTLR